MKIEFHDDPIEQTTSATDVLMALLAAGLAFYLSPALAGTRPYKAGLWLAILGLVTASSALGAVAHGFKMSPKVNRGIWQPINLLLGLTIALFAAGASLDLWGESAARGLLPYFLLAGGIFFLVTVFIPGTFLVFIVYEALAMLFALIVYTALALGRTLPGAWWMAAGVLVMMIAAAIQTRKNIRFTAIWQFDYNGAFHFIQMAGIALLGIGLAQALF